MSVLLDGRLLMTAIRVNSELLRFSASAREVLKLHGLLRHDVFEATGQIKSFADSRES